MVKVVPSHRVNIGSPYLIRKLGVILNKKHVNVFELYEILLLYDLNIDIG